MLHFFKQRTVANKLLILTNFGIALFLIIAISLMAIQLSKTTKLSLKQKIDSTIATLQISTPQYFWSVDDIPLISIRDKIKEDKDFVFINFYVEDGSPFIKKEPSEAPHIIKANITRKDEIIGFVEIGYTDERVLRLNEIIIFYLLIIGIAVQFILSILSYYIIKRITSPISQLTEGVRRFGRGDFNIRIPVSGNDEISDLARTFNQMTEELAQTMKIKEQIQNDLKEMNALLEKKVEERTEELRLSQDLAIKNAHAAGMAEISTQILHNIGNVTNSVNISVGTIRAKLSESKIEKLLQVHGVLKEHEKNLELFFKTDPRAGLIGSYIIGISEQLKAEHDHLAAEITELFKKLNLIKGIIYQQQEYAKGISFFEQSNLKEAILEVLSIQENFLKRHQTKYEITFEENTPHIPLQKTKFYHILINIIKNAVESMENIPTDDKRIIISTTSSQEYVYICVRDNGCGIDKKVIEQIFVHGFTTKKNGHGFGLHFCANAIKEMGGELLVQSEGTNRGSTFTIKLRLKENQNDQV